MAELTVEEALRTSLSENTRTAYRKGWRRFVGFCEETKREPMEATGADVAQFLVELARRPRSPLASTRQGEPLSLGTIRICVSAINRRFRDCGRTSPAKAPVVASVLHGLTRRCCTRQRQVKALPAGAIQQILAVCDQRARSSGHATIACRDAALISLGFSGALRRSEICGLNLDDIEFIGKPPTEKAMYVTIRKSKTDQAMKGQRVAVPDGQVVLPVTRLRRWLAWRGRSDGPLFRTMRRGGHLQEGRLHDSDVARLLKHYTEAIGLDPADYSGHSLRAGFVTSAAEHGARLDKIMEVTRHQSAEMVLRYIRTADAFEDHAGAAFL